MVYSQLNKEEIARRGEELYQKSIRSEVENPENIGKIIAVDLNTGEYEIDKDLLLACHRLQKKLPLAVTWVARIGYDAVYAVGGTLIRTV